MCYYYFNLVFQTYKVYVRKLLNTLKKEFEVKYRNNSGVIITQFFVIQFDNGNNFFSLLLT